MQDEERKKNIYIYGIIYLFFRSVSRGTAVSTDPSGEPNAEN